MHSVQVQSAILARPLRAWTARMSNMKTSSESSIRPTSLELLLPCSRSGKSFKLLVALRKLMVAWVKVQCSRLSLSISRVLSATTAFAAGCLCVMILASLIHQKLVRHHLSIRKLRPRPQTFEASTSGRQLVPEWRSNRTFATYSEVSTDSYPAPPRWLETKSSRLSCCEEL